MEVTFPQLIPLCGLRRKVLRLGDTPVKPRASEHPHHLQLDSRALNLSIAPVSRIVFLSASVTRCQESAQETGAALPG